MEELRTVEEIAFDELVSVRIEARKSRNNGVLQETEEAFKKATKDYIDSVYNKAAETCNYLIKGVREEEN